MTTPGPRVIWTGTVDSGTFRLVDLGPAAAPRFVLEVEQAPDAFGSRGWTTVGLPFADVLESALSALLGAHAV